MRRDAAPCRPTSARCTRQRPEPGRCGTVLALGLGAVERGEVPEGLVAVDGAVAVGLLVVVVTVVVAASFSEDIADAVA